MPEVWLPDGRGGGLLRVREDAAGQGRCGSGVKTLGGGGGGLVSWGHAAGETTSVREEREPWQRALFSLAATLYRAGFSDDVSACGTVLTLRPKWAGGTMGNVKRERDRTSQ